MSISGYPEYTESGIPWLGVIPSDWQLLPFFSRFSERKISNKGMKCNNLLSLSYGRIVNKDITTLDGLLPASFETYQIVHKDDIVFRLTDLQNDKRSLRSAIVSEKGIITSAYLAVVVHGFDAAFSSYLFRAYDLMKVFYSMGGGLRQSMKYDDMKWLMIAAPTVNEQTQIARFLDHETAKIDTLIQEQKRLIELLKEKRQAVISHAVTKGLDPNVPMKDSGVEWLGEVPVHWEVTRLKFVATIIDCKNRTPEYFDDGDYLVVRTSNVRDQSLKTQGAYYTDEENYRIWTQRGVPPVGSLLFTREAPAGEVCIVPEGVPLCLGQRMMNFIPDDPSHTPFIFDFLTSDCLVRYMESVAHGSTVSHLRVEQVYDIPLVIPPIEEQEAIDRKVSVIKTRFKDLMDESKRTIGLLIERRSALISAAVTGKIDVRDWQPPADESTFDEKVRQAEMEAES